MCPLCSCPCSCGSHVSPHCPSSVSSRFLHTPAESPWFTDGPSMSLSSHMSPSLFSWFSHIPSVCLWLTHVHKCLHGLHTSPSVFPQLTCPFRDPLKFFITHTLFPLVGFTCGLSVPLSSPRTSHGGRSHSLHQDRLCLCPLSTWSKPFSRSMGSSGASEHPSLRNPCLTSQAGCLRSRQCQ